LARFIIRNVRETNWDYIEDAIPEFLMIVVIPITFKY
jgi:xanthine/uracil/vitamin C permease (AzgA family)